MQTHDAWMRCPARPRNGGALLTVVSSPRRGTGRWIGWPQARGGNEGPIGPRLKACISVTMSCWSGTKADARPQADLGTTGGGGSACGAGILASPLPQDRTARPPGMRQQGSAAYLTARVAAPLSIRVASDWPRRQWSTFPPRPTKAALCLRLPPGRRTKGPAVQGRGLKRPRGASAYGIREGNRTESPTSLGRLVKPANPGRPGQRGGRGGGGGAVSAVGPGVFFVMRSDRARGRWTAVGGAYTCGRRGH